MTLNSLKSLRPFGGAAPILIGLLLLARLIGMAEVPLMDTTEARYAEIGRKMVELNDWVTPWFDYGVPYWGKPPLSFWATAISFKLFGINEFAARLPHLVFSLLIVALVGWLAGRRDRKAALPAVALISGASLYFVSAGAVMTDIELILGTSLAMAGFWLALEEANDTGSSQTAGRHSGWGPASLFFGGLILGLLAKGPVALVLTGTPLFLWTAYNRRWLDVWRRLPWVSGVVLTLLISLPWYLLAERRTPGFLEYFLIGEHWHRFVTPGWHGDRYGNAHNFPIGTIWAFAFIDTLPWSILLPLAAWHWRRRNSGKASITTLVSNAKAGLVTSASSAGQSTPRADERTWQGYLLFWTVTPLLFFTATRNIIMTYVLPGLPAAAIWAGGWLARQGRQGRPIDGLLSIGLVITLLLTCAVAFEKGQPAALEQKSAKALVAAYDRAKSQKSALAASDSPEAQSAQRNAPLIFIWFRPFSGQFYSFGQAIKVPDDDEAWRRIGASAAYVVTRWGDAFIARGKVHERAAELMSENDAPTGVSPVTRTVTSLGHYGDFELLFVAAAR